MIKWLKKLLLSPYKVVKLCRLTPVEQAVSDALKSSKAAHQSGSTPGVILVESVEDIYYLGLFGKIALALRERYGVVADQFVLRSVNVGESSSWRGYLFHRLIINPSYHFKWAGIYATFCRRVAFRGADIRHPFANLINLWQAWRIWKRLETLDDLNRLVIQGVAVGDLVNDTYLRFKPAVTVDIRDIYLWVVIWQACCEIRRSRRYFGRVKPFAFLTSYTTYVQHGIVVRVALACGIEVFSFGNLQEVAKRLSLDDWMHTKNPLHYARDFASLSDTQVLMARARAGLNMRMSGGIDSATAYMANSSYANSGDTVPAVKDAIVVFLHDFYDSPHVYYDMVFHDFWEWICFTIETLTANGQRFLLKPHPNQIGLSGGVIDQLRERYPDVEIMSSGVTNVQLADAGAACAVTVYGTVAHEMAYLGVPSITCARHPHVAFEFCRNAHSRQEYVALLATATSLSVDKSKMREQSLMFYCMHNLDLNEQDTAVRAEMIALRKICGADEPDSNAVIAQMEKMAALDGFSALVDKLGTLGQAA